MTEVDEPTSVSMTQWSGYCKDCRTRLAAQARGAAVDQAKRQRAKRGKSGREQPRPEFDYTDVAVQRVLERGETRSDRCPACRQLHRDSIRAFPVAYVEIKAIGEAQGAEVPTGPSGPLGGLGPLPDSHIRKTYKADLDKHPMGLKSHHILELLGAMAESQVVVLEAGTGTGKSTLVPYRLMNPPSKAGYRPTDAGPIVVTQPRILATTEIATFVGESLCFGHEPACGEHVGPGYPVGYQCEGRPEWDESCQLVYVTDGTLLNWIIDGRISRFSTIIIDEAHERSATIDAILTLLAEHLHKYPKLRVVIASATIDAEFFLEFFAAADITTGHVRVDAEKQIGYGVPLFPNLVFDDKILADGLELDGQKYDGWKSDKTPITDGQDLREVTERLLPLRYRPRPNQPWTGGNAARAAADQAFKIIEAVCKATIPSGDVIAFLPGEKECRAAKEQLTSKASESGLPVKAYWLMKDTPDAEKKLATAECRPGSYKVVFASNLAETSLTIAGLRYVVDSGLIRQSVWDPDISHKSVPMVYHSRSGVRQRWGRVGRKTYGWVFPLYGIEQFEKMPKDTPAGSTQTNLEDVLLKLSASGVRDLSTLRFPANFTTDKRDEAGQGSAERFSREVDRATRTLLSSGALSPSGDLTPFGRELHRSRLPAEQTTALLFADRLACFPEVAAALALLSGGELAGRGRLLRHDRKWPVAWRLHARRCHEALAVGCADDLDLVLRIYSEWQFATNPQAWADQWWLDNDVLIAAESAAADMMKAMAPGMSQPAGRRIDLRLASRARAVFSRAMLTHEYVRQSEAGIWRGKGTAGAGAVAELGPSRLTEPGDRVIALGRGVPEGAWGKEKPALPYLYGAIKVVPWACDDELDPFRLMLLCYEHLRGVDGSLEMPDDLTRYLRQDYPVGTRVRITVVSDDDLKPEFYYIDAENLGYDFASAMARLDPDLKDLGSRASDVTGSRRTTTRAFESGDSDTKVSYEPQHNNVLLEEFNDARVEGLERLTAAGERWWPESDGRETEAELRDLSGNEVAWEACSESFRAEVVGYSPSDAGMGLVLMPLLGQQAARADWRFHDDLLIGDEVELCATGVVRDHFSFYRILERCDDHGALDGNGVMFYDGPLLDRRDVASNMSIVEGSRWRGQMVAGDGRFAELSLSDGFFSDALVALRVDRRIQAGKSGIATAEGQVVATNVVTADGDDSFIIELSPDRREVPRRFDLRVFVSRSELEPSLTLSKGDTVSLRVGVVRKERRSGRWPVDIVCQLVNEYPSWFVADAKNDAVFMLASDACLETAALEILLGYAGAEGRLVKNSWDLWSSSRQMSALFVDELRVIRRATPPAVKVLPVTAGQSSDGAANLPEKVAVPAIAASPPARSARTRPDYSTAWGAGYRVGGFPPFSESLPDYGSTVPDSIELARPLSRPRPSADATRRNPPRNHEAERSIDPLGAIGVIVVLALFLAFGLWWFGIIPGRVQHEEQVPQVTSPSQQTLPQGLAGRYAADTATANASLIGRWVPQLASIRVEGTAEDVVLQEVATFEANHGAVLILRSSDFVSMSSEYWIVVVNAPHDSEQAAQSWCNNHQLASSKDCLPKFLTH